MSTYSAHPEDVAAAADEVVVALAWVDVAAAVQVSMVPMLH